MTTTKPAKVRVVAVDGPTAAGKTTLSRQISSLFNIGYLESGRAYRMLAHEALMYGVSLDDDAELARLCRNIVSSSTHRELLSRDDGGAKGLRTVEVTRAVSLVAKIPQIRTIVTALTRSWANSYKSGCIVEGRDTGTTVFPDAIVKIFLTATPAKRATRRLGDEPGRLYDDVLADVVRRDEIDSTRSSSPLAPAADATVIDTSEMTIRQVTEAVSAMCVKAGFRQ